MRGIKKYLLIMLLPLCVLLAMPIQPALVLLLGDELRLAVRPVDPREVFRGDHVLLSFEIEELSLDIEALPKILADDILKRDSFDNISQAKALQVDWYIILSRDIDGLDKGVRVQEERPEKGSYITGKFVPGYSSGISFEYGENLKRFYVKENTGPEIEKAMRFGSVTAVVKVWRGKPVLSHLIIPDKRSAEQEHLPGLGTPAETPRVAF